MTAVLGIILVFASTAVRDSYPQFAAVGSVLSMAITTTAFLVVSYEFHRRGSRDCHT